MRKTGIERIKKINIRKAGELFSFFNVEDIHMPGVASGMKIINKLRNLGKMKPGVQVVFNLTPNNYFADTYYF